VNVSSIEAHRASPGFAVYAVYAALKAARAQLTQSLALELAPRRIVTRTTIHCDGGAPAAACWTRTADGSYVP
jgi:NAD(P)-dependent dehydrogenase (short-subunit alcohol dehydrogenase family)